AVLRAQVVGVLLLPEHHLHDARGVAQVDEDHAAVVPAAGHPAGECDALPGVFSAKRSGVVSADHEVSLSFRVVTISSSGTALCSPVCRFFTWAVPAARSRSPRITAWLAPERSAPFIAPLRPLEP